jgi:hypothetical protein
VSTRQTSYERKVDAKKTGGMGISAGQLVPAKTFHIGEKAGIYKEKAKTTT